MEDRPSYLPPVALGEPMRAGTIGQVVSFEKMPTLPRVMLFKPPAVGQGLCSHRSRSGGYGAQ